MSRAVQRWQSARGVGPAPWRGVSPAGVTCGTEELRGGSSSWCWRSYQCRRPPLPCRTAGRWRWCTQCPPGRLPRPESDTCRPRTTGRSRGCWSRRGLPEGADTSPPTPRTPSRTPAGPGGRAPVETLSSIILRNVSVQQTSVRDKSLCSLFQNPLLCNSKLTVTKINHRNPIN